MIRAFFKKESFSTRCKVFNEVILITRNFVISTLKFAREHSRIIHLIRLHILSTCSAYYIETKPKSIRGLATFKSYDRFTDFQLLTVQ